MSTTPHTTIFLFTKAPRPGEVKTRLAADTGDEAAARLHASFVQTISHMLERAVEHLQGTSGSRPALVLARADESHHPLFDEDILRRQDSSHRTTWLQHVQRGADLGARLQHAVSEAKTRFGEGKVIIIGSDSPTLTEEMIVSAVAQLDDHDVVLGPSFDGGYYLVGLANTMTRSVFERITWSSPHVLGETLARCQEGGLNVKLLNFWYDVDTIDDLHFLRTHLLQYLVASPAAQHYSSVVKELERLSVSTPRSE